MSAGKKEIVIVDYGMGNPASIKNMIKKCGGSAEISNNRSLIERAGKLIIPGVGSFAQGMENLKALGLTELLKEKMKNEKVLTLGICLGMQLLTTHSEEGNVNGLNIIPAKTIRFNFPENIFKVPHMGWNEIDIVNKEHWIFSNTDLAQRFYFVHSYYVKCEHEENVFCKSTYGITFDSGIISDNVIGLQFHPEKSHRFGYALIKNFIEKG